MRAKPETSIQEECEVVHELTTYFFTCGFGMMVFFHSSASFVWGIEDIVGATVYDDNGTEEEIFHYYARESFSLLLGQDAWLDQPT